MQILNKVVMQKYNQLPIISMITKILITCILFVNYAFADIRTTAHPKDHKPKVIEPPQMLIYKTSNMQINTDNVGEWSFAGVTVGKGKSLNFTWRTSNRKNQPDRYMVLLRKDPRFWSQTFVKKYDYKQKKYIFDFFNYTSEDINLMEFQGDEHLEFNKRLKAYKDYFNKKGGIKVKAGDIVEITLDKDGDFFNLDSDHKKELGSKFHPLLINTKSPISDNKIIYSTAKKYCDFLSANNLPSNCKLINYEYIYEANSSYEKMLSGYPENEIKAKEPNIPRCSTSTNHKFCYYDQGERLSLNIGGTEFKSVDDLFAEDNDGNHLFYFKAPNEGNLIFNYWISHEHYSYINSDPIKEKRRMSDWGLSFNDPADYDEAVVNDYFDNGEYKYITFGRYLMHVMIGNGAKVAGDNKDFKLEYYIKGDNDAIPTYNDAGTPLGENLRSSATKDGTLWIRVIDYPENISANVDINIKYYEGETWISTFLYDKLIGKVLGLIRGQSQKLFNQFVSDATFQNIARAMLSLYILIYGLMFMAGFVEIKLEDLVTRIIKIALVLALFSKTSWQFFNEYLFTLFLDGLDSLFTSVTILSTKGNPFSFIDPIFAKYTNSDLWKLLGINLLSVDTGLTFTSLITIWVIVVYIFVSLIYIIVGYTMSFVSLAVMISLAPFFITFILFEKTKGMFQSWFYILFSYMIKPMILLLFFLLVEQIISEQVTKTVVRAEWGIWFYLFEPIIGELVPIYFYIPQLVDVNSISDLYSRPGQQSGTLPSVFIATLLFFLLGRILKGAVEYVDEIVELLSHVQPPTIDGIRGSTGNVSKSIASDIISPISGIYNKVVGQRIRNNSRSLPSINESSWGSRAGLSGINSPANASDKDLKEESANKDRSNNSDTKDSSKLQGGGDEKTDK